MSFVFPRREAEQMQREAAAWVLRRDRGLTAAEQDEFSQWLAKDPRHRAGLARQLRHWDRLDLLAHWLPEHGPRPNPDLLAPVPRGFLHRTGGGRVWRLALSLAAAAAIGFGAAFWWPKGPPPSGASVAAIQERTMDDGSIIQLNRGAEVSVVYTAVERRVHLERGEAHFTVAKNPLRPFIVSAGGVNVRAVGTAFDVRLDHASVAVLVTEGRVHVNVSQAAASAPPVALDAGQRAVVSLTPAAAPPEVITVAEAEMNELLSWQPRLLDFVHTPLSVIVAEFNRRNAVQMVIADPGLGAIPLTASMRSDNVEGFVRLLEAGIAVRAERAGDTLTLRRSR